MQRKIESANPGISKQFRVGDLVHVEYGSVFKGVKWPAFKSEFYEP